MTDSENDESVFSFENQHQNIRTGVFEDDCSYYSDEKRALNKPKSVARFNPEKDKRVKVAFFETPLTPNRYIRNAVTGNIEAPFRVGTCDEYLYYSVLLSTGEHGQTPPCLFYDTPEQYERHFFTTVSDEAKSRWRTRYAYAVYERNKKHDIKTEETQTVEIK